MLNTQDWSLPALNDKFNTLINEVSTPTPTVDISSLPTKTEVQNIFKHLKVDPKVTVKCTGKTTCNSEVTEEMLTSTMSDLKKEMTDVKKEVTDLKKEIIDSFEETKTKIKQEIMFDLNVLLKAQTDELVNQISALAKLPQFQPTNPTQQLLTNNMASGMGVSSNYSFPVNLMNSQQQQQQQKPTKYQQNQMLMQMMMNNMN
jgi:fructose-bisphosphate aldolase class 1